MIKRFEKGLVIILLVTSFVRVETMSYAKESSLLLMQAIGFKDIYLGSSKENTLKKINNYGLDYMLRDFKTKIVSIDPYFLLSKEFLYKYTKNAIKYAIEGETYYISLNELDRLGSNFRVLGKKNNFELYYSKLSSFRIGQTDGIKLNPLIRDIRFSFYDDALYKINYRANFRLDEIIRYIKGLKSLYGQFSFKFEGDYAVFVFSYGEILITFKVSKETYNNISHMEYVGYKEFTNQKVYVSILNTNLNNLVLRYQNNVYRDMLYLFKRQADENLKELKETIKTKKDVHIKEDTIRERDRYKAVDDLLG